LVVPQFILGLILGFIRMSYGLNWSIIYHFLHNGLAALPIVLISFLPVDLLKAAEKGEVARVAMMTNQEAQIIFLVFALMAIVSLAGLLALISLFREYFKVRKI